MKCRYCASEDSKVIDSRHADDGASIRRRRECAGCGRRFTTYEKMEELPIMVIKKDGRRQPFDSEKIRTGVRRATEKRPISSSEQDNLVEDVVREVFNSLEQEIKSTAIGEMVMKRLKELDDVAYVRFASVYRQFKDINTFIEELETILRDKT